MVSVIDSKQFATKSSPFSVRLFYSSCESTIERYGPAEHEEYDYNSQEELEEL